MSVDNLTERYRPPIHVQVYFWSALATVSAGLPFLIASSLFGMRQSIELVATLLILVVAFQSLFWFACRRCSSEELTARDGLLYITAYMTVGVGSMSFAVAVPCVIIAILLTVAIGALTTLGGGELNSQQKFHSMVAWFSRHRMYQ